MKMLSPVYSSLIDFMVRRLFVTVNRCRSPQGIYKLFVILFILGLLAAGGVMVYMSGGTAYVYTHIMYLPVLIAAFAFRVPGGVITAVIAGFVLGPYMPLDVQDSVYQDTFSWLYRMFFFVLIGVTAGGLASSLCFQLTTLTSLISKLSINHAETLKTFGKSVAYRDEQTGGHCERVAYNAYMVGKEIGLEDNELENLYWAGLLHDLGKIGVPEHILLKPGKLTEDEYEVIKQHSVYGYDILMSLSSGFEDIARAVRAHHERWDGRGYPDGLAGNNIPVTGRILAAVDVFEALTSPRPYREPLEGATALKYLLEQSEEQFDPGILVCFEKLFNEGKILLAKDWGSYDFDPEHPVSYNEEAIWAIPMSNSPFSEKTTRVILNQK